VSVSSVREYVSDKAEWSVTVVDPETWTRPWTFSMPLTMNPRERVIQYACHEGNRALANMLNAARAEERARRTGRRWIGAMRGLVYRLLNTDLQVITPWVRSMVSTSPSTL
jgi:hypothetical protein